MHHLSAVTLVSATLLITIACGSDTRPPEAGGAAAPPASGAAEALQADAAWMSALQTPDPAAVGAALDAAFEWTNAEGVTRQGDETQLALAPFAAEFRAETDRQTFNYGHIHVITSSRPGARMMRVWGLRPAGWRLVAAINTTLATGGTPFAAAGAPAGAECENPCEEMPFEPNTERIREIVRVFRQLKTDEWRPNPDNWAPYVLDDVYYVTATAQLSKADRVEHLRRLKESGASSVPGDPVTAMRIRDFGDAAVMLATHRPYRGGKPYYSLRTWAFRDGRWQLANTQQTVIAAAPAVEPVD